MPVVANRIATATDTNFQTAPVHGNLLRFDTVTGTSKWVDAGLYVPTVQTSSYTAVASDFVLANATSGTLTVTLPSAATATAGALVRVQKTDSSANGVIVKAATGNLNGLTVSGSLTNTASKTANYTAVSLDNVQCNATSGLFTVTLPAATNGSWVRVTKTDASVNGVLVVAASGTIDGDASAVVNQQLYGRNFVADGTNWHYMPDTYVNMYNQLRTQSFISDGTNWWVL